MDGISLNGRSLPGTATAAMIDTGTTDLYLPPSVAQAMMEPLNGQLQRDGSYVAPTASITDNLTFSLIFAGQAFDINYLDIINGFTDSSRQHVLLNIVAASTKGPSGEDLAIVSALSFDCY
jgi:hypothetical protein